MARKSEEPDPVNLTPMIDVIFQMIIFFVFTIDLDKQKFDPDLELAQTKHMKEVKQASPATKYVDVVPEGYAIYMGARVDDQTLEAILANAVARAHPLDLPVVVRGAATTQHRHIKRVLNVAVKPEVGVSDVRFAGRIPKPGQAAN